MASELGEIRHERRVASIVRCLFDITLPLHNLNRGDLRLLKLAAYVHDVGRSVNDKDHPAIGVGTIRWTTLPEKTAASGAGVSDSSSSR